MNQLNIQSHPTGMERRKRPKMTIWETGSSPGVLLGKRQYTVKSKNLVGAVCLGKEDRQQCRGTFRRPKSSKLRARAHATDRPGKIGKKGWKFRAGNGAKSLRATSGGKTQVDPDCAIENQGPLGCGGERKARRTRQKRHAGIMQEIKRVNRTGPCPKRAPYRTQRYTSVTTPNW